MNHETPHVTMLPAEARPRGNPYLDYLEDALQERGVRTAHDGRGFRWRELVGRGPLPTVYHLHWLDTLHTGGRPWQTLLLSLSFLLKLLVVRLRGRRLVWTVHNLLPHYRRGPADRWCRWATAQLAHGLIVHNDRARERVGERFHPRVQPTVVLMGHYEQRYGERAPREEARRRLALPAEPLLLLVFGQLRANKGLAALIKLFLRVNPARCRLVLAGRPASRNALEPYRRQLEDCEAIVLREGFVPDEEVRYYFGAVDGFLYDGADILSSSAVVLALSYGVPVLAPRLPCLEGVVPEEARIDFDATNSDHAERVLDQLEHTLLARAGEAGRAALRERTWEQAARVHCTVYGLKETP